MQVHVPYGDRQVTVEIDERNFGGALYPNGVETGDETAVLSRALMNPHGSGTIEQFISDADEVVFVVNDRTRPTPTARVLEHIYPVIRQVRSKFIVATGSHRPPTGDEYRGIFGELYGVLRDDITAHDAKRTDEMVYLGTTARGTRVCLNRLVAEADRLVVIGSVEPHYFAGYTGGRKAFVPGVASYETIEQNHRHALSQSAQSLVLEGNPVHEDMADAMEFLSNRRIFSVMTVLDASHRIYAAAAGDVEASFRAAVRSADQVFSVRLSEKADIVVAVARYPMVVDLYQSQNTLDNGKLALKNGGILILVSQCSEGVGLDAFVRLLGPAPTMEEAVEKIEEGYKLGYHKAAKMAEIATWAEMWAVTDLDPEILRSVFLRPFPTVQEAVDEALAVKGPTGVLFLMSASMTVPRVAR